MTLAYGGVLGFVLTLAVGPLLIPWLRRAKFGQTVRDVGPESHFKKNGTPTMGGILFLLPLPLVVLIFAPGNLGAWNLVMLIWGFGLIGFADDWIKVALKRPLGLKAREKIILQLLIAGAFTWIAARYFHSDREFLLPFHWGAIGTGWFYAPLSVLAILGSGNAVNITDGLDGLAAGATAITFAFFVFWGIHFHQMGVSLVALTLVGSLIGFMRFNLHPARVFMGDTGSLALGAAMAGMAIFTGTTLILPILGLLFVLETLSVIIQVISFRTTGKRVFKMSPIHHHFELIGWSEERVVSVFWLISLVGALLAWL